MKAARLHEIGNFTCDEIEKPTPTGDELLIKISACGICGSDIPRVFELGTSKKIYPLTLGHEFSGTVVEVGDSKNDYLLGKTGAVFPLIPCGKCDFCITGNYAQCSDYDYLGSRSDGGFAEYCLIPSKWHLIFSNNPSTTGESLAMVEPATVAQHAIRKSKLKAGETVVIIGAGPIGIIAARWAEIFGAQNVVLIDINDEKVLFARERGFTVINSKNEDCVSFVKKLTDGKGAEVVIEGTGSSDGLNNAINIVRTFGRITLLGNPNKDTLIKLKNHSSLLRKEITLKGVWNSYYSNLSVNEWRYTVDMLDKERLFVSDLITHKSNLEKLPELFSKIYNHDITICKALYVNGE
ncbi:galactitol-1-phosphate 5-dehydrogenase [Caldifermentibacillus hisashii]|uniref:galactitol-1-phosphate 5-dehydrogenase n=1 Tax=Caldifermentibacillus hisashii TaxID=996558 RepID=UPI0030EAC27D